MNKFKVGDRVRVRDDAVVGEKYNGWTLINQVLGKVLVVKVTYFDGSYLVTCSNGDTWCVGEDALELVLSDEIHITTDGETVHAIHKQGGKVVSRAKAVCAPSSTFDFSIGAKLAFERVMNIAPAEDKPAEPPRFDWELFRTGKQAVNCQTEHDAEVFLAWLAGRGCRWCDGDALTSTTRWTNYREDTAYVHHYSTGNGVEYTYADFYANEGLAIIPFTREMLAEVDA